VERRNVGVTLDARLPGVAVGSRVAHAVDAPERLLDSSLVVLTAHPLDGDDRRHVAGSCARRARERRRGDPKEPSDRDHDPRP